MAGGLFENAKYVVPERLHPNKWNPNVLSDADYERLRSSLRRRKWVQPILAFWHKSVQRGKRTKRLTIIDGEHRWRIAKDEGHAKIPVLILDVDERAARELTINLNYLGGEPNEEEYSKNLQWFIDQGEDAVSLSKILPLSHVDIDEMLATEEDRAREAQEELEEQVSGEKKKIEGERVFNLTFGPFTMQERNKIMDAIDEPSLGHLDEAELITKAMTLGVKLLVKKQEKKNVKSSV